jgi:hypothetical protein
METGGVLEMNITYLDWDSSFFGLKIGKCELSSEIQFDEVEFIKLAKAFLRFQAAYCGYCSGYYSG